MQEEESPAPATRAAPGSHPSLADDEFLADLEPRGDTHVVGPVRLEARISRGGMGVIYRGRHVKLGIDVAVKFLLPHLAEQDPEYVVRFEREARIAAQLNNENLVRVFDADSEQNYHYVVMEFVCGENARERVARKGPLPEDEALEIVRGATRGLSAAHRKGIIHRDIKPENIMIDSSGVVKLADLGIAKVLEDSEHAVSSITQSGSIMGTPSFMGPEQFEDSRSVRPAVDVYSMGATLYFLLTGKAPFVGSIYQIVNAITAKGFPDVRARRPEVSEDVARLLKKCTRIDPAQRYSTGTELLQEIERLRPRRTALDGVGGGTAAQAKVSTPPRRRVGAVRVGVTESGAAASRGSRRPRVLGVLAAASLLVAAFLAVGGFVLFRNAAATAPAKPPPAAGDGEAPPRREEAREPIDDRGPGVAEAPRDDPPPPPVPPVAPPAKETPGEPPEETPEETVEVSRVRSIPTEREPAWALQLASGSQVDGARAAGVELAREIEIAPGIRLRFLYVPPGQVVVRGRRGSMGRRLAAEHGFYLAIHEVTREAYRAVAGRTPEALARRQKWPGSQESTGLPATHVSWEEAVRFCRVLSERFTWQGTPLRARLPGEAEWEYACRAGSSGAYPWGDRFDTENVWCWINSRGSPRPVGTRRPNAWGFHDVLGNVREWCAAPDSTSEEDERSSAPGHRVLRGGSWNDYKGRVHPEARWTRGRRYGSAETGFRVALDP